MKSLFCLVFFLMLSLQGFNQTITGKVYTASNGIPMEYVSIGVIDTPVGTITDEKGHFTLDVRNISKKAVLRFSMIGYKSQTYTIEQLSNNVNLIKLEVEPVQLQEVVIKPSGKYRKIGALSYTRHGGLCGWGGTDFGKGHEIGIKIDLGNRPVRLKSLHLHLDKQSFDSSIFRLHIRNIENDLPKNELLNRNILITISKESGWNDVDLRKYNVVLTGNIALSLEWIKVTGVNENKLRRMNGSDQYMAVILFSIKRNQGCTYTRWGSEAKWYRTEDQSPCFYLTIEE